MEPVIEARRQPMRRATSGPDREVAGPPPRTPWARMAALLLLALALACTAADRAPVASSTDATLDSGRSDGASDASDASDATVASDARPDVEDVGGDAGDGEVGGRDDAGDVGVDAGRDASPDSGLDAEVVDTGVTPAPGGAALRFYGNGVNDIDRVKIRIDRPDQVNDPGPPVDVGATDFTIEFFVRGTTANNSAGAIICGANDSWITGNIVFDRDRFNQNRKFGVSFGAGRPVFGVSGSGSDSLTICGASSVLDGQWHHVAVQRRRSDGFMWLFIDGALSASADGPDGDISYPDDAQPGNFCNGPCTDSDPFIVLGAEKHDAGRAYPSYNGELDELRISTVLRYSGAFAVPTAPFSPDADTAGLYHFDTPPSSSSIVVVDSATVPGAPTDGVLSVGGSPVGPRRVSGGAFGP